MQASRSPCGSTWPPPWFRETARIARWTGPSSTWARGRPTPSSKTCPARADAFSAELADAVADPIRHDVGNARADLERLVEPTPRLFGVAALVRLHSRDFECLDELLTLRHAARAQDELFPGRRVGAVNDERCHIEEHLVVWLEQEL